MTSPPTDTHEIVIEPGAPANAAAGRIDPRLVDRARTQVTRRRYESLAAAIRTHETWSRRQIAGPRRHDELLYRHLRRINGDDLDTPRSA